LTPSKQKRNAPAAVNEKGTFVSKSPFAMKLTANLHVCLVAKPEPSFIDVARIKPIRPDFDWRTQKQLPYRPWKNGPYHVTMGKAAVRYLVPYIVLG
jgi:hypothetical protein